MTDETFKQLLKQLEAKIAKLGAEIRDLKRSTNSSSIEGPVIDQLSGNGQKIKDILKTVQDRKSHALKGKK
jgi:hypothetical protein